MIRRLRFWWRFERPRARLDRERRMRDMAGSDFEALTPAQQAEVRDALVQLAEVYKARRATP